MPQNQSVIADNLKHKREHLIDLFFKGRASHFLGQHTRMLDTYFHDSFEASRIGPQLELDKNPYAIIALGGYGREEQCLHSDVDLLFLFKKRIPDTAEGLTQEIVYPLWDIGLDVGYAMRSLDECIDLARHDYEILTPLLDARFICGMSILYTELLEKIDAAIIKPKARKIIDWLIAANRDRHLRFGDSSYRLEPNLKEGQGGLRDYHTMLWIGRILFNLKQSRDLEVNGYLSSHEFQQLSQALDFIWEVRNRLHHLIGRKYDQLHFEHQITLADSMQYEDKNGQKGVENFLSDLHRQIESIKQQHLMLLFELGYSDKAKYKSKHLKYTDIRGLEVVNGALRFGSLEIVLQTPALLMKIFEESSRLKIPLSIEAKRIVGEFGYLVDEKVRTLPAVVKSFERILLTSAPTFNVLKEMLNTGLLVRLIPEMNGIVNRIQYDEYHLYPVDIHLLRTVQTIKKFGTDQDDPQNLLYGNLFKELKNRKLLLWAALLHDIGKGGDGGEHSAKGAPLVRQIMTAKGYKPQEVDTVAFLTREHLLLVKAATRRDINDEETALNCARRIKAGERLKMLYLLTVADSIATGPNAWSDWTATLLRDLFLKVLNVLEKGDLATQEAVNRIEENKQAVLSLAPTPASKKEAEDLFSVMSPRYLLYMPADEIVKDMDLYRHVGPREFSWQIFKDSNTQTRTVRICAKDHPGLFSKIAGVFTLNNLDILDAQIFTWRNHMALDVFELKPPLDLVFEAERWAQAEKNLHDVLSGRLDLRAALQEKSAYDRTPKPRFGKRPHRIDIDNQSSSFFTIVEVFTYDYPGLLYSITDALFRCGLDIWVAIISTKVDQVVDVFYVRDFDGQKVDTPEQEETIRVAIEGVVDNKGLLNVRN